jgi:hypothetical protein
MTVAALRCPIAVFLSLVALLFAESARADLPPGEVAVPVRPSVPPPAPPTAAVTIETAPRAPAMVAIAPPFKGYFVIKLEGGVVHIPGAPLGGYGRFSSEGFWSLNKQGFSPIWGLWIAHEGWGIPRAGGYALPVVGFGGFRTPAFLATLGAGFNLFTLDGDRGTLGGGLFSPRAMGRIGLHIGRAYIAATAEVQRRWRWGLDDITLFQAGLALGIASEVIDSEKPDRKP